MDVKIPRKTPNAEEVEKKVVRYYLDSRDYNGISLLQLAEEFGEETEELIETTKILVEAGRISIVSPRQSNPFIKMIDAPIDEQLDRIEERDPRFVCLYPTPESVATEIDPSAYDDKPFTKMMVLGAPQLVAISFRLDVLDFYQNDPRNRFWFHDFGGTISTHDKYYNEMEESDRTHLRFGVGYDDEGDRVVAVYLYDLASIPAKQQRILKEYWLDKEGQMSEEYFKTSILAEWPDTISVYQAFILEQAEINELFSLLGHSPLFRETYEDQRRPRGFSFFVKPTKGQYDSFIHLLDKMLSDNINIEAFGDEIERFRRIEVGEGEFERQQKGSITLLEEWLRIRYPAISDDDVQAIVGPIRKVRNLRQKPAHTVTCDEFDKAYYGHQDELVWEVYHALSELRKLLMSDDAASSYEPPSWDNLHIKSYL